MGLTYSSVIDADRDEVFSWHTRPGAITRLIPPWQPVRVLREAGSLRDGRAILALGPDRHQRRLLARTPGPGRPAADELCPDPRHRMTDRRMTASRPQYADYVARTSGFIPLPPKRAPKRSAAAAAPGERA